MARWLLGLKADELSAQKTFRMLNAFIVNQGDLLQQGKLRYVDAVYIIQVYSSCLFTYLLKTLL